MRKLFFVIVLLFPVLGIAQTVEETSKPLATQEDLNKVTNELRKANKATAKLAEEARLSRESAEIAQQDVLQKTKDEAKANSDALLAKQAEEKAKTDAENSRKTLQNMYVSIAVISIIVITFFAIRKGRKKEVQVIESFSTETPKIVLVHSDKEEPLTNPTIRDLKRIAEKTGLMEIPFVRQLGNRGTELDGMSIACVAQMQTDGKDPRVRVGDDILLVAFDKHVARATKMLTARIKSSHQSEEVAS